MEIFNFLQVYIISIAILLVILIKIIIDKENDCFEARIFTYTVSFTISILIVEAIGWAFDRKSGIIIRYIITISDALLLILILVPGVLWVIYINYKIYADMKRIKRIITLAKIMLSYITILSISAPFNSLLFYIDEANRYHRGSWYWQSQVLYYSFFIYGFIVVLLNRKHIPKKIFLPLISFSIPPFIETILQMIFYDVPLLGWSSISISLLIVYVYIQSQKIGTDYLTGLFNRRKLDLYLEDCIKNYSSNKILAIIMIDVDDFKKINDTWGHKMGDKALEHCAAILRSYFKYNDFIARYAGDEFVVVLELNKKEDIISIIKRLKEIVRKVDDSGEFPYKLSFSIGYAIFPDDGIDAEEIFEQADSRMYMEKKNRGKYLKEYNKAYLKLAKDAQGLLINS